MSHEYADSIPDQIDAAERGDPVGLADAGRRLSDIIGRKKIAETENRDAGD